MDARIDQLSISYEIQPSALSKVYNLAQALEIVRGGSVDSTDLDFMTREEHALMMRELEVLRSRYGIVLSEYVEIPDPISESPQPSQRLRQSFLHFRNRIVSLLCHHSKT